MIGQLEGLVVAQSHKSLILRVAGVGYVVQMTPADLQAAPIGKTKNIHTYLAVRETSLELFGFDNEVGLRLFEKLLTLPKIGPRTALAILSVAAAELIIESVQQNDPDHLTRLSGLSPARAEKVVTGLKGKLDEFSSASASPNHPGSSESETLEALHALGYTLNEARRALRHTNAEALTAERLREALRYLNQPDA